MPFGEELLPDGTFRKTDDKYLIEDGIRQKFTGCERDEETGLDFAEARYYNKQHARFTAVDPLLASGKSSSPQTFNRYVYVMNNPLAFTDPTGLQVNDCTDCQWYANQDRTKFSTVKEKGFESFEGAHQIDATDKFRYLVTGNSLLNLGKTSDIVAFEGEQLMARLKSLKLPGEVFPVFPNPLDGFDGKIYPGEYINNLDTAIRNGIYSASPDYFKFNWSIPLVFDVEFSVSKDLRAYGGFGTPFGSYAKRPTLSFNPIPDVGFGYFLSGVNGEDARHSAMAGPNFSSQLPLSPVTIGVNKSLPSGGMNSFNDFAAEPVAIEFLAPGGGSAGLSTSEEIFKPQMDGLRSYLQKGASNVNNQ